MAVLPLPDMTPEFIAYSNGPMLLAQVAPIYAIAALVVLGRCYVRVLIVKSFRWDDWTMLVCLVSLPRCFTILIIFADTQLSGFRNIVLCRIRNRDPPRRRQACRCDNFRQGAVQTASQV